MAFNSSSREPAVIMDSDNSRTGAHSIGGMPAEMLEFEGKSQKKELTM